MFVLFRSKSVVSNTVALVAMAAGEDVLVCPGCKIGVKDSDKALQCDGFCDKWHHIACVGVESKDYKKIVDLKDIVKWICVACAGKLLLMKKQDVEVEAEKHTDLRKIVEDVVKMVKEMKSFNVQINNRLTHIEKHERLCPKTTAVASQPIDSSGSSNRSSDSSDRSFAELSVQETDVSLLLTASKSGKKSDNEFVLNKEDFPEFPNKTYATEGEWSKVEYKKKTGNQRQTTNEHYNRRGRGPTSNGKHGEKDSVNVLKNRNSDRKSVQVVIGTSNGTTICASEKKAWFYLGRLRSDTSAEAVKKFISDSFAGTEASVEKLDSKGENASFKIGVDFDKKDDLFNSSVWPKNSLLKRFLFIRPRNKPPQ